MRDATTDERRPGPPRAAEAEPRSRIAHARAEAQLESPRAPAGVRPLAQRATMNHGGDPRSGAGTLEPAFLASYQSTIEAWGERPAVPDPVVMTALPLVPRPATRELSSSDVTGPVALTSMFSAHSASPAPRADPVQRLEESSPSVPTAPSWPPSATPTPAAPPTSARSEASSASTPISSADSDAPHRRPHACVQPADLDDRAIDRLVARLYEPLSARLRAELSVDRERVGRLLDVR